MRGRVLPLTKEVGRLISGSITLAEKTLTRKAELKRLRLESSLSSFLCTRNRRRLDHGEAVVTPNDSDFN
jgi:hypothetical protein